MADRFVQIGRHKFCDDYLGYDALRTINIPSMNTHISNMLCSILFISVLTYMVENTGNQFLYL